MNNWQQIRQQVLERDSFRCVICGVSNKIMATHHKVPTSSGGPDTLENMITLCFECHYHVEEIG
jgi:5-methylcytosine-specific restriction endonuclease McrA